MQCIGLMEIGYALPTLYVIYNGVQIATVAAMFYSHNL